MARRKRARKSIDPRSKEGRGAGPTFTVSGPAVPAINAAGQAIEYLLDVNNPGRPKRNPRKKTPGNRGGVASHPRTKATGVVHYQSVSKKRKVISSIAKRRR